VRYIKLCCDGKMFIMFLVSLWNPSNLPTRHPLVICGSYSTGLCGLNRRPRLHKTSSMSTILSPPPSLRDFPSKSLSRLFSLYLCIYQATCYLEHLYWYITLYSLFGTFCFLYTSSFAVCFIFPVSSVDFIVSSRLRFVVMYIWVV
jgi:hypothetical protein